MTKHVATCKNTADGCEQEDAEEETTTLRCNVRMVRKLTGEATTSGSNARAVGKLTGETLGTQSDRKITGTVMEERRVEETPPTTWEQVPQHLSTDRCKVTGESSKHTEKV